MGAHHQHLDDLTSIAVTKTHYLAYWKEDSSSGGNAISIKGDRGIQCKRGATCEVRFIGPHGPKVVRGDIGPSGGAGVKGDRRDAGPFGRKGERGVAGVQGEEGNVGSRGPKGEHCARGPVGPAGPKGVQCVQGAKGDRSERGEHGVKGEKGIQGDNSDVLSILAEYLPIQLATRYGEKMWFIKYHVSEDRLSIIELYGRVGTLRSISAYHEPAWHFDVKFVSGQGHEMANVQKATGHGHFLEMKNSAYHCPYDLASNKVNVIYIVYKIRKYNSTGTEHNSPVEWAIIIVVYASLRMKRQ